MFLKKKLEDLLIAKKIHRLNNSLIYGLGLVGIAIIAAAIWLTLGDRRNAQQHAEQTAEWSAAVSQLSQPLQALNRVMFDPQVQVLAVRALESPENLPDLTAYLNGRINAIREARVFDNDLDSLDPQTLGPNGFAILDMLMTLEENRFPQLQIHHNVQPTVMVDAVKISDVDEVVGYLVIFIDPEYLLSNFNPSYGSLGYMALTQYNGRIKPTILREVGNPGLVSEVPERQVLSGTLFRIEYPMYSHVAVLPLRSLLVLLAVGVLLIAVAIFLYRINESLPEPEKLLVPALQPARLKERIAEALPGSSAPAPRKIESKPEKTKKPESAPGPEPKSESGPESAQKSDQSSGVYADAPPMRLRYDIAERNRMREHEHEPVELVPGIFRAYDIRGVIDKTLDTGVARQIGRAIGAATLDHGAGPVVVARDGRLSGPYLQDGLMEGILSTGCDVLDIGAVPTGVLYYAAHEMANGSGVVITGSHNPPDYNGFKIMIGGHTLFGNEIHALYQRIVDEDIPTGEGHIEVRDVVPDYIERIAGDIQLARPLKVILDCGNGIGGVCATEVLQAIGAEVLPMFDEVDGTFPNHHPDPGDPENLVDLIDSVRLMDADLGLALDGDADRLGVVTLAGNIIFPDRILMLLAMDVLDRNPGSTIMYDVKCTNHLAEVIREAGGKPFMYKTGHSLIKAKMKEIDAPLAGEMSGHFFFKERWYGVDDGIYSAARLLEILAASDIPPEAILNALPTSFSTPELKVEMNEGENFEFMDAFRAAAKFPTAEISTIDGIRADFADGWGLVRCSNTTPILVVRFDAESEVALERIKDHFRTQMLTVKPDLDLPF